MGVPVLTGADGRLAITEVIGQKTVEARARLHNLSKTGDDSGRLQTTPGDNELYTRQRVIKQLKTKAVHHQTVTKTALIGFESRWGRHLPYNSCSINRLRDGTGLSCSTEAGAAGSTPAASTKSFYDQYFIDDLQGSGCVPASLGGLSPLDGKVSSQPRKMSYNHSPAGTPH